MPFIYLGMVDNMNKYGSAVIYAIYFTLFRRGMVDNMNKYGSIRKFSDFYP